MGRYVSVTLLLFLPRLCPVVNAALASVFQRCGDQARDGGYVFGGIFHHLRACAPW